MCLKDTRVEMYTKYTTLQCSQVFEYGFKINTYKTLSQRIHVLSVKNKQINIPLWAYKHQTTSKRNCRISKIANVRHSGTKNDKKRLNTGNGHNIPDRLNKLKIFKNGYIYMAPQN